ncbi:hypothetical protein PR202_ga24309 [Eleusine coracana subsp. coracana]|uniref:Uncharacterized protein n=1 Tax=Eleusine coracana subsp. coracana TaxID=191504 RepID=A0AAV5D6K3_ELECO|nr:hypothetical protein PR202_ga24309 [Eleusine coracana subsp. coracana]
MEAVAMSPSSASSHPHNDSAASTSEDMSLQEGLLFSDSLKDLRNLRSQLYSAAEYFEVFYRNNSHKSTVMTSLKDYTVEALVSTVDHLGFVSYKVDNLVSEKADEVNETEFRVSSVEQRVRICHQTIDQEGRSQQSLLIKTPKYHRRYILPGNSKALFCCECTVQQPLLECIDHFSYTVQRQTSMQLHTDWDNHKEQEKFSSKGRGFLKSLLTRRRWRNDESLYSYLDEY